MATNDDPPPRPEGLTDQQELYCQLVMTGSYADAYRAAYNPRPGAAINSDIWKLNRNPKVTKRIRQLQAVSAKKLQVTREWLLEWWFLRMTYDPAEITAWAVGSCRYCHGDGHNYQWREPEFMDAISEAEITQAPLPDCSGGFGYSTRRPPHPDCPKCDGNGIGRSSFADTSELSPAARAGFEGVEETRQGIKIRMADRVVAAENFAKLSGWDVVQIRHLSEEVPLDEDLAKIANDPIALANLYKRLMAGGSVATH